MLTVALALSSTLALSAPAGELSLDPAAIDAIFAAYDRDDGPGCALGIVHDGELVYARGYGMASLEHDIPNAPDSVFRIGSTSKQFTAACAVLAAQEGHLSLDDDIREHLPEMPDYGEPVTLRHLLHHTSGIRDYLGLMSWSGLTGDDYYDDEAALTMIARQRELNFAPGEDHTYSNSGYFLISVIVARATGMSMAEFARTRIFEPLGMRDTHFHDDHRRIVPRRSEGYSPDGAGGWVIDRTTLPMIGDGGVFTTVEDLLLWDRNFYEPKVGGGALLADLQRGGVLDDGSQLEYALGLVVRAHRGLPVVHHGGAFVGYRAEMVRFPEERVSVICLGNTSAIDPSGLCFQVADVLLAERSRETEVVPRPASVGAATSQPPPAPTFVELDEAVLARFAGEYMGEQDGALFRVSTETAGLLIDSGARRIPLRPTGDAAFAPEDPDLHGRLVFERASEEAPWRAWLELGARRQHLSRHIPWDPASMQLEDYGGTYYSPELDASWTFEKDGDRIAVAVEGMPIGFVVPLGLDRFESSQSQLVFERDAFHEVTGFRLHAGRVRNLRFERR